MLDNAVDNWYHQGMQAQLASIRVALVFVFYPPTDQWLLLLSTKFLLLIS